ncbi:hypothetical protein P43SY_002958 [Pythium insidiosum]|uniref:PH domain-containing protein n=1 Tax=Pythium insidiosum TaxID=114742 RepID=A0AAD5LE38_PYTIN|nr:hypothetical protein P43SY_002958 [Pythium insidiosum]
MRRRDAAANDEPVVYSGVLMLHRSGARRLGRRAWAPRFVRLTASRLQLSVTEHGRVRQELTLAHSAIEVLPLCTKSLRPWRFAVSSPADKKRLVLAASSARERSDWIERLACQVHAASRREASGDGTQRAELLAPWTQTATDCQIFRPRRDRCVTLFRRHSTGEIPSTAPAVDLADDTRLSTGQLDVAEAPERRALDGYYDEEEEKQEEDRVLMALRSLEQLDAPQENKAVDAEEPSEPRPLFHYKKESPDVAVAAAARAPSSEPLLELPARRRSPRSRWFSRGHSQSTSPDSDTDGRAIDDKPRRYSTGCMPVSPIGVVGCERQQSAPSASTAPSSAPSQSSRGINWLGRLRDHLRRRRRRKSERQDSGDNRDSEHASAHSLLSPRGQREREASSAGVDWKIEMMPEQQEPARRWRSASFMSSDRPSKRSDSDDEEIVVVLRRRRHSLVDAEPAPRRMRVIVEIDAAPYRLAVEEPRRETVAAAVCAA